MAARNTKQKIINATGELIAEHGLDNVSTRMVAKHSGENIGSIHYHLGCKNELFKAVIIEAMTPCLNMKYRAYIMELDKKSVTPAELSKALRLIVAEEITVLFRGDSPLWHTRVIYQLLQQKGERYKLFKKKLIEPSKKVIARFFSLADPKMKPDEIHLRSCLLRMPIFTHANYMTLMLEQLGTKTYSQEYLQKMEDLLVKQTQLLMNLPKDKK